MKDKQTHSKNIYHNNIKSDYSNLIINNSNEILNKEFDNHNYNHAPIIACFTYIEKKEFTNDSNMNNSKCSNANQKIHNSNNKINLIGNLSNNSHLDCKNQKRIFEIKKNLEEIKKNKREFYTIKNLICKNREKFKEIISDRNELIADKINLENKYDCLVIKYNKILEKIKNYFTAKEKHSNNLNINQMSFSSVLSFGNHIHNVVNTEKNLDDLIYELEIKLAYVKIENGMIWEKNYSMDDVFHNYKLINSVIKLLFLILFNYLLT